MTAVLGSTKLFRNFIPLRLIIRPKAGLGSQTDTLKHFGTGVSSNTAPRVSPNDAKFAASPHCRRNEDSKMV